MQKKSKFNVFTFMMLIIMGLTFQSAISTYAACPDDISSYWKLDELTPGTYKDFIKDNNGMGNANPTAVAGQINGAQEFDGLTNGIDVPVDKSFNWAVDESFSIEFWVRRNGTVSGSEQVAIGRDDPTTSLTSLTWWSGIAANDAASFVLGDNDGGLVVLTGTTNITDDAWHHVVAVRDGANNENLLYVDAGLPEDESPATYSAGFDSATAELNIGYWNFNSTPSNRLGGMVDEVALYDRALTPAEIQDHFDDGLAGQDYCLGSAPFVPFPDDTISLWQLDEATPGAPNGTYVDSFDGNNGTGNDNPTAVAGQIGGAQEFDGLTNGIDVPVDKSFNWAVDESFSIEFWVRRNGTVSGSEQVAIGRDDPTTSLTSLTWWSGIAANDAASFVLGDNDGGFVVLTGTTNITDDAWHHVVAVRDGANNENLLYVDAGLPEDESPATYNAGFDSATAELNIGYWNFNSTPSNRLGAMLDEVALYDRALTPAEIQDHFDAGDAGNGVQSLRPPPVASAGDDQANVIENTEVTLVGSDSDEGYAAAPITTYLWEQTAGTDVGTITDADKITATFDAPDFVAAGQPLTFQLTVTASDGQSDSDTVDVGVVENILPVVPVADAGDPQSVTEGDPVTLDGTESTPVGGISYLWVQTPASTVTLSDETAAQPTFTAPQVDAAGATLRFELTVTDGLQTDSDTVTVTVNDNPQAPTADAGADQDVKEGNTVTLDGSNSSPASGSTITTYLWVQTSGTKVQLAGSSTATATFTAPDVKETLNFRLTVTDDDGLSSSDTVDVTVSKSGGGGGGGGGGCFINSMF